MIKLGVISDTHWNSLSEAKTCVETLLNGVFADAEAILHAGDLVHPDLELLFAPLEFIAVKGNMDSASAGLPVKRIINYCGINIGMIHSWGAGSAIEANARNEFAASAVDVLIYGHSHMPCAQVDRGLLVFNPGSATQRRRAPFHSIGLIHIGNENGAAAPASREEAITGAVALRCETIAPTSGQQVIAEIINIDAGREIV